MELTGFSVLMGIVVFFFGMFIFSYLNRAIRIFPEGMEEEEDEKMSRDERKALKERQRVRKKDMWKRLLTLKKECPYCGHPWTAKESIPVFSRLVNKKCNACSQKIPVRDTIIEIMGGVLGILPVLIYGFSFSALTVFLAYCILVTIAVIDMDTQYIPPELNLMLGGLGLLSIVTLPGPTIIQRLIGVVCISVPLLLIALIVPGAFGGGDIKMMAAVGLLLGWKGNVIAFLIGVFLGGGYGAYVLATKKMGRKEHFAFGPFLAVGIAISLYGGLGARVMDSYIHYIMESFKPY